MSVLRSFVCAVALATSTLAWPAAASVIVLDFEGIAEGSSVNSFYAGGTDSAGASGVNYGINFLSGTTRTLVDSDAGGSGSFANEPSANTIFTALPGTFVIDVAAGFETGFSLYSEASTSAQVLIFDGLGGAGNFLAGYFTPLYSETACQTGDPTGLYCNWMASGVTFSGVAKSVVVYPGYQGVAFDNVTFGSATPLLGAAPPWVGDGGGPMQGVPEPAAWALMILGFGLTGAMLRRRGGVAGVA